jgi:hypothetical protein
VPGNEDGEVVAFNDDGSVLWRFSPIDNYPLDGLPDAVFGTPALGDLDGDGLDDVAFGAFDFRVWALKGTNGSVLPSWPVYVRDSIWSSPALADLDGNGSLEVRDGTIPPGWPKALAGQVVGSPALGNLDADAALEIVAPVIKFVDAGGAVQPNEGYIYAFNGRPGACHPRRLRLFPVGSDRGDQRGFVAIIDSGRLQ